MGEKSFATLVMQRRRYGDAHRVDLPEQLAIVRDAAHAVRRRDALALLGIDVRDGDQLARRRGCQLFRVKPAEIADADDGGPEHRCIVLRARAEYIAGYARESTLRPASRNAP